MKLTLRLPTLVFLLALASAVTWGLGRLTPVNLPPSSHPGQSAGVVAAPLPPAAPSQDESENIEIYRRVSPGVVNITSTTLSFDFFFSAVPKQGSGSGSIIDAQGHILTNYHVIEEARLLEVTLLTEERKFEAKVVGIDPTNDLAIIKIDPANAPLAVVPLGSSAQLRVGQKALAIGNPFGLQGTLTAGVDHTQTGSLEWSLDGRSPRLRPNAAGLLVPPGHRPHEQGALVAEGMEFAINPPVVNQTGIADGSPCDQYRYPSHHVVDHLARIQGPNRVGPALSVQLDPND